MYLMYNKLSFCTNILCALYKLIITLNKNNTQNMYLMYNKLSFCTNILCALYKLMNYSEQE
jgi:hypothetical protein